MDLALGLEGLRLAGLQRVNLGVWGSFGFKVWGFRTDSLQGIGVGVVRLRPQDSRASALKSEAVD